VYRDRPACGCQIHPRSVLRAWVGSGIIATTYSLPWQIQDLFVSDLPPCPECKAEFTYEQGILLVCPSCGHEWTAADGSTATGEQGSDSAVRDAHGNVLQSGDTVVVIKDLKVKGSSLVVKGGTKVKNIRLVDGDHDIDCKIDGIGAMQLKSEFVKKA
jgi:protein PhnA